MKYVITPQEEQYPRVVRSARLTTLYFSSNFSSVTSLPGYESLKDPKVVGLSAPARARDFKNNISASLNTRVTILKRNSLSYINLSFCASTQRAFGPPLRRLLAPYFHVQKNITKKPIGGHSGLLLAKGTLFLKSNMVLDSKKGPYGPFLGETKGKMTECSNPKFFLVKAVVDGNDTSLQCSCTKTENVIQCITKTAKNSKCYTLYNKVAYTSSQKWYTKNILNPYLAPKSQKEAILAFLASIKIGVKIYNKLLLISNEYTPLTPLIHNIILYHTKIYPKNTKKTYMLVAKIHKKHQKLAYFYILHYIVFINKVTSTIYMLHHLSKTKANYAPVSNNKPSVSSDLYPILVAYFSQENVIQCITMYYNV